MSEAEVEMKTSIEKGANSDFLQFAHHEVNGTGMDYSLVAPPQVTDDFFSLFLNGTAYNPNPMENFLGKSESHPNMEIGSVARQDMMMHLSESTIQSILNRINSPINGSEVFDMPTYQSYCKWLPDMCDGVSDLNASVNYNFSVGNDSYVKFSQDHIHFNGSWNIVLTDGNTGDLIYDFSYLGISIDINVQSNPLFSQIFGNISPKFESVRVNRQGSAYADVNSLLAVSSDEFNDRRDWFNGNILKGSDDQNNRHHEINWIKGFFVFREMEMKVVDGLLFFGAEFDDMYIGRPQNWGFDNSLGTKYFTEP
jgi:hypothetical protein